MTGVILVCVAAFLWGTVGVANALMSGARPLDPALVGLARTGLGSASLIVAAALLRVPAVDWRRLPLRLLALFGLAGAAFQTCLFAAFVEVGVTVTVAVTVCAPVVLVIAGDALWKGAMPDRAIVGAAALATLGVVLALPTSTAVPLPRASAHGAALLVVASVAFAVVAAAARALGASLHPLRASGLGLAATAIVLAVAAFATSGADALSAPGLPGTDLLIIAYTGFAATGGAYFAFVLGMRLSRSAAAGLAATLIEPGVAALLAALVLGESLTLVEAAGCALMLSAMILLFRAERRLARDAPPG